MIHDYVIVGAGAAGCVLANRLSADPDVQVLLVEAGGRARNPLLAVPRAFYLTLRSDRYVDRYPTRATADGTPAEAWIRGRGLGGSTLVNGMMYVRGAAADFDALEAAGNPGWGSAAFLRAYRELEELLAVTVPSSGDEVTDALFEAAGSNGLRRTADFNDSDDERIGFTPATISRGRRVSAASAFLAPARSRPNLTIVTGAHAERIVLDGRRAVGVVLRHGGRSEQVRARREVLVAAGTIGSPLLLERSGIGRTDVLRAAGVPLVAESKAVGGESWSSDRSACRSGSTAGTVRRSGSTPSRSRPWRVRAISRPDGVPWRRAGTTS